MILNLIISKVYMKNLSLLRSNCIVMFIIVCLVVMIHSCQHSNKQQIDLRIAEQCTEKGYADLSSDVRIVCEIVSNMLKKE